MYIPLARDAVEIEGQSGLFYVVRADYRHRVADVIPRHGRGEEIRNVPFQNLYLCRHPLGAAGLNLVGPRFTCNPC